MIFTIYRATNIVNGKVYIGFDSKWPNRRKIHLCLARKNKGYHLHRAIAKYGVDRYFVAQYHSDDLNLGYNLTIGGDGSMGYKHTIATKSKMRGRKFTNEHKQKLSDARRKRKWSEETKRKIAQSMRNYHRKFKCQQEIHI